VTEIRPATEADIEGMAEMLRLLFTQEAEFAPSIDAQRDGLRAILASPSVGRLLVAEADGALLGMVNLLYTQSTALGGRVAILEDMIVVPAERGSGVASRLLDAAIDTCRGDGCRRITLLTDADNSRAQKFYERSGFCRSTMVPYRLPLTP
jgi:GNAT superfamily N-acetyltransferase